MATNETEQLGLKIESKLLRRLRSLTTESKDPYAPTMTQVVERGISLALDEMEKRK